jgi:hypothetical protein
MVLVLGSRSMSGSVRTRRSERVLAADEAGLLAEAVELGLRADEHLVRRWSAARRRLLAEIAADLKEAGRVGR